MTFFPVCPGCVAAYPFIRLFEENERIRVSGLRGPVFRHKLPLVKRFWGDRTLAFNFLHQVETQVFVRTFDDAFRQFLFRNTGPLR